MKRTIRRTIVVEYESELSLEDERGMMGVVMLDDGKSAPFVPPFAESVETVDEVMP